jgi:hypothetical protein
MASQMSCVVWLEGRLDFSCAEEIVCACVNFLCATNVDSSGDMP